VLLVVSFSSMRSRWVIREVQAADRLGRQIIPVHVDGAPYPDELRMILSGVQQLDLTNLNDSDNRARQLSTLDDALLQAAQAHRRYPPGRTLITVGSVLTAVGVVGAILGFGLFVYLGIITAMTFARFHLPTVPQIVGPFLGFGLCMVSGLVAGVGRAVRRAGLKKGI
jgi:hypothetical protein